MIIKDKNLLIFPGYFTLDLNQRAYLSSKTNKPIKTMPKEATMEKMTDVISKLDIHWLSDDDFFNLSRNEIKEQIFENLIRRYVLDYKKEAFLDSFIDKAVFLDRLLEIQDMYLTMNLVNSIILLNEYEVKVLKKIPFKDILKYIKKYPDQTISIIISKIQKDNLAKEYKIAPEDIEILDIILKYSPKCFNYSSFVDPILKKNYIKYCYWCYKRGYHLSFLSFEHFIDSFFAPMYSNAYKYNCLDFLEKKNIFLVAQSVYQKADGTKKEQFKEIYKKMDFAKFEDENFIVVFPSEPVDLTLEGQHQNNCVGSYLERILRNETIVVFVRKKNAPKKSYITCDFSPRTGLIYQFFCTCNQIPRKDEEIKFCRKFQQHLYNHFKKE